MFDAVVLEFFNPVLTGERSSVSLEDQAFFGFFQESSGSWIVELLMFCLNGSCTFGIPGAMRKKQVPPGGQTSRIDKR